MYSHCSADLKEILLITEAVQLVTHVITDKNHSNTSGRVSTFTA